MNNFEKQLALLITNNLFLNNGVALLPDTQLKTVWQIRDTYLARTRFGSSLPLSEDTIASTGSITVLRNGGVGEFKQKTTWGSGTVVDGGADSLGNFEIAQISVYADHVINNVVGVARVDIARLGTSSATQIILADQMNLLAKQIDEGFFQYLAKQRTTVAPANAAAESQDPNVVKHFIGQTLGGKPVAGTYGIGLSAGGTYTNKESLSIAFQQLIEAANSLKNIERGNAGRFGGMGITGIPKEKIFISLSEDLFDKLVNATGLETNYQNFLLGTPVDTFVMRSGYRVYPNRWIEGLTTADGVPIAGFVATGDVGVAPWGLKQAVVKSPTPSLDLTTYMEAIILKAGGRVIYDSYITIVYSGDQSTYEKEVSDFVTFANSQVVVAAAAAALKAPLETALKAYTGATTVADFSKLAILNDTNPSTAATVTTDTIVTADVSVPVISGKSAVAQVVGVSAKYKNA